MSNGITLIIIGNEILEGLREDNNFVAALKYLKGVTKIKYVLFVRDDLNDIRKALLFAKENSSIVIASGGLGLTPDDITLKAFSETFQIPIVKSEEKLRTVKNNLSKFDKSYYENFIDELSLGLKGATPIPNPKGVAAGEKIKVDSTTFYIFPGIPKEFEAMLEIVVEEIPVTTNETLKVSFEVKEKEANLISVLREIEEKFNNVKTASYPPIEQGEKLTIILYGEEEALDRAKDFLIDYFNENKILYRMI